jgi:hemerythrin-like metal-binding protein
MNLNNHDTNFLCTGNVEIDKQHNNIISSFNNFIATIKSNKNIDMLKHEFVKLNVIIDEHLFTEEELLKRENYHNYEEHLKEHNIISDKLRQLYNLLQVSSMIELPEDIIKNLIEFVNKHIIDVDVKSFKKARNKKATRVS